MFGTFGEQASNQGMTSIGSNPFRQHQNEMEMAGLGMRGAAVAKAGEWQRQANLDIAEIDKKAIEGGKQPSNAAGLVGQGLGAVSQIAKAFGGQGQNQAGNPFGGQGGMGAGYDFSPMAGIDPGAVSGAFSGGFDTSAVGGFFNF